MFLLCLVEIYSYVLSLLLFSVDYFFGLSLDNHVILFTFTIVFPLTHRVVI